jgi:hypothetical protein
MSIIVIVIIFMTILIIAGPETLSSFLNNSILYIVIISLSFVGTLLAILTLKKSYLSTMNKVRLIK